MLPAAEPVDPAPDEFCGRRAATGRKPAGRAYYGNYTTVLCRAMQVRSTSSIGFPHQSLEKISISE